MQLAAQEAARIQQYLQLTLPPERVLFVDDEEGLAQATKLLSGDICSLSRHVP
jgi:hypothetical protein